MDPRAIAHARVEAQRLLKCTKAPSFAAPQTLGAAQNLVAVLKGFPHWHALLASARPDARTAASDQAETTPPLIPRAASALNVVLDPEVRLLPAPGEPARSSWVYARPGSGKSLTLALHVLDHCLPRVNDLPRVAMVDVGPSAVGLVETLRAHLPPGQRQRQVRYLRVTGTTRINPLDTPLGLRAPIGSDRQAKISWLHQVLGMGPDSHQPLPRTIVEDLLDQMYQQAQNVARHYESGIDPDLDAFLNTHDPIVTQVPGISWWNVVDACMDLGRPDLARRAQRQATPTLQDLGMQMDAEHHQKTWLPPAHRDSIVQSLRLLMRLRSSWFMGITTEDWDDARVVVLDLDAVCRTGGDLAQHLTAVSYLSAQVVLGNQPGTLAHPDDLQTLPVSMPDQGVRLATLRRYQAWHAQALAQTPTSVILYDEMHRCNRNNGVMEQVLRAMESTTRSVLIASQDLDTLEQRTNGMRLLDVMHQGVVLDRLPARQQQELLTSLGWNDDGVRLLDAVEPIRRRNAGYLRLDRTPEGWAGRIQHRPSIPLPVLWGLTTTGEDVQLRTLLVPGWGWQLTVQRLAQRFPAGTCRQAIAEAAEDRTAPTNVQTLADHLWWQYAGPA